VAFSGWAYYLPKQDTVLHGSFVVVSISFCYLYISKTNDNGKYVLIMLSFKY
jgi:hypothetical protein